MSSRGIRLCDHEKSKMKTRTCGRSRLPDPPSQTWMFSFIGRKRWNRLSFSAFVLLWVLFPGLCPGVSMWTWQVLHGDVSVCPCVSMCVHVCVFGSSVFVCLGLSVVLCVVVSPLPSSVSLVNSTSRCSKLIYQLCLSLTWRDGPLTVPPGWLEVGSAAKCPG